MHMDSFEILTDELYNANKDESTNQEVDDVQQGDEGNEVVQCEDKGDNDGAFVDVGVCDSYAEEYENLDGGDSLVVSLQFIHGSEDRYDDTNILIDTRSIVSVIKNEKMTIHVTNSKKILRTYTNGGHQDSTKEEDLAGIF